ncbi:unnamed protein product [Cladocopium goreaui]|uniref:Uncharacterized protein n=1 Tax=Cladocopium goreaui TaxID=2562237 RepID=A0A9P1GC27_9DINO|nr:unnamed protein product [Cladocopium goreaui]
MSTALRRNTESDIPMTKFEWHFITWREMEELTEERLWDSWAKPKTFQSLPPAQETRHRLNDKVLWMGDGTSSLKFTLVNHENLKHKPSWRMSFVFTSVPEGTLCFEFTWLREKKEMKVSVPTSGQEIGKIPGRWGPRTVFHKVMDAFLGFCDLSSGNPSMILGSCQIAAVKEDTVIGPEMRKLTLEELWGDFGSSGDVEGSSDEDARLAQQMSRGNGLPRGLPHETQQRPKQKVQNKMKKPASAAHMKKPARKV